MATLNAQRVRQRQKHVTEFTLDDEFSTATSPTMATAAATTTTTKQSSDTVKCYHYMNCSVYQIANLACEENLHTEMLPLFAILLGNDYVHRSILKKFFLNVSMKNTGKKSTMQGKRIVALLRWLKNETLETAIEKIINHVEKEKKQWLRQQINVGIAGYVHEKSMAYEYFQSNGNACSGSICKVLELDADEIIVESDDDSDEQSDEHDENADDSDDKIAKESGGDSTDDDEHIEHNGNSDADPTDHFIKMNALAFEPPKWLLQKILDAKLPRYIVDLITLRLYINAPQVENFQLPDCNGIAVPILRLIFTYLHYPQHREFRYLTRIQRRTDIEYKRYDSLAIDTLPPFCPENSDNFEFFKLIFADFTDLNAIFHAIGTNSVPPEHRLFFWPLFFGRDHRNISMLFMQAVCSYAV